MLETTAAILLFDLTLVVDDLGLFTTEGDVGAAAGAGTELDREADADVATPFNLGLVFSFSLGGVLTLTTIGDDGAVITTSPGDECTSDGGGDGAEGVEGAIPEPEGFRVRTFFALFVLAFSSSSDEGYEPEILRVCVRPIAAVDGVADAGGVIPAELGGLSANFDADAATLSALTSCANAPYEGARFIPAIGFCVYWLYCP